MENKLVNVITDWVRENFGESEVEDPSWNIEALAHEIAKHKYEFFHDQELEYMKEDVEYVAEAMQETLTDKEMKQVVDRYYNSDAYGEVDRESIEWYIYQVIKERNNNE